MKIQDANLPWKFRSGDIVDAGGFPYVYDTDEEIAALIVRAVNHHEALVEMVRVMSQEETDDPAAHMRAYAIAKHRARVLLAALDADNA